jgi:hypothetical protein
VATQSGQQAGGVVPAAREIRGVAVGFVCRVTDRSGPSPLFTRPESPIGPRGAGDGLGSPDGLRAYSGGNEEPGAQLDRITPSRRKKTPTIDLVGETAGDALSSLMGFCCTKLIHTADLLAIKG